MPTISFFHSYFSMKSSSFHISRPIPYFVFFIPFGENVSNLMFELNYLRLTKNGAFSSAFYESYFFSRYACYLCFATVRLFAKFYFDNVIFCKIFSYFHLFDTHSLVNMFLIVINGKFPSSVQTFSFGL